MARPRDPNTGMVVAREACVVIVGARAGVRHKRIVTDRHTSQPVEIDMTDPAWGWAENPVEGKTFVFKPFQRVPANHPAVKASPNSFVEIDSLNAAELELVTSG